MQAKQTDIRYCHIEKIFLFFSLNLLLYVKTIYKSTEYTKHRIPRTIKTISFYFTTTVSIVAWADAAASSGSISPVIT